MQAGTTLKESLLPIIFRWRWLVPRGHGLFSLEVVAHELHLLGSQIVGREFGEDLQGEQAISKLHGNMPAQGEYNQPSLFIG